MAADKMKLHLTTSSAPAAVAIWSNAFGRCCPAELRHFFRKSEPSDMILDANSTERSIMLATLSNNLRVAKLTNFRSILL
jgi:hypothetical protein